VRKEPSIFILLLLASFASVSAVLFTPALPDITRILGLKLDEAEWTITIFIIGYALGNLLYGPFSNRFGRKPALFLGISLAIIGNLLIIFVKWLPFYWLLLIGRFVSALGSSVGLKISFTMIGDIYKHEKAIKKIAYITSSFAIGPGIAIAIGGFLTDRFGWESTFYFLTAYSVFLLLLTLMLPETCEEKDPLALNAKQVAQGYIHQLKNPILIFSALLIGCGTTCIYLFAAIAPFVGIDYIGMVPEQYGLWFFIPSAGLLAGTFLTQWLTGKIKPVITIDLGIALFMSGAIVMLILFLSGLINPYSLFIPMPFLYMGIAQHFANASGITMTHAKNKSNASAMLNFINMGVSVIALIIIGYLPKPLYLLPLVFAILSLLMILFRQKLSSELNHT